MKEDGGLASRISSRFDRDLLKGTLVPRTIDTHLPSIRYGAAFRNYRPTGTSYLLLMHAGCEHAAPPDAQIDHARRPDRCLRLRVEDIAPVQHHAAALGGEGGPIQGAESRMIGLHNHGVHWRRLAGRDRSRPGGGQFLRRVE